MRYLIIILFLLTACEQVELIEPDFLTPHQSIIDDDTAIDSIDLRSLTGGEKSTDMTCYSSGKGLELKFNYCANYVYRSQSTSGESVNLLKSIDNTVLDSIWLMTGPEMEALYESATFPTIGNAALLLYGEWKLMKASIINVFPPGLGWEFDFFLQEDLFLQLLIGAVGNGMSHLNYDAGVVVDTWTAIWSLDNSYFTTQYILNAAYSHNWGQVLWFGNNDILLFRSDEINTITWYVMYRVN